MKKIVITLCCLTAVLALGFAAGQAMLAPAVVGSVDLERVFNESRLLKEAEKVLSEITAEHQKEADRLRGQVDMARQDLEILVPGTPQHTKAQQALIDATVEFRAYVDYSQGKLELERAESRRNIYGQIADAAAEFAVANGIDYIITNDSGSDLQEGTDRQVVQQLLLRRVVYASPQSDVTDDLIAWINKP